MFGSKKVRDVKYVCDPSCVAQRLREEALFKAAQFGPRI